MESEILEGFVKQTQDYLPTIRGGILVCAQKGNTFGELDNALRQVISLREAAQIIGLDDAGKILNDVEKKLIVFAGIKQPMTNRQANELLDKLTEFEALLTKIQFNTEDFTDNMTDFVEESFGQWNLNPPPVKVSDSQKDEEFPTFADENFDAGEDFSHDEEEEFEIDDEMLEIFALEAEDLIRSISVNLEILVEKPNDREALMEIRRNAHTLKGSAGIVGLKKLSEVAHRVEDLLDFLADHDIESNEKIFELLLTSTDCFEALAASEDSEQLNGKITRIYAGFDQVTQFLRSEAEKETADSAINLSVEIQPDDKKEEIDEFQVPNISNQPRSIVRVSLEKLDDLVRITNDLIISRSIFEQRLVELEQQMKELHNSTRRLQSSTNKLEIDFEANLLQVPDLGLNIQTSVQHGSFDSGSSSFDFDALEFDHYTDFHQTTRELIETTGDTFAINSELDNIKSHLDMVFDRQHRLIDEMQDKILRLRMVHFGSLSTRLHRTVRVVCDEEDNKSVELLIEGENLEVDTQILDALIEPLLHLIRNAVAHGIESTETRRLLGKPETGKISLRVYGEGTHIIVVIDDDGRGISASSLKTKAVGLNLISQEKAASMSDEEAYSLIFLPGLTTAEKLSQVSGRGIGMNIIKTGVERQSGTISIASEPQKGTTFTLRLPVALAVTRSILVKSGGQTFAFPLNIVKHIGEIPVESLRNPDYTVSHNYLNYNIYHLNKLLNMPFVNNLTVEKSPILLIDLLENPCALVVDSILKTEEIVIKPFGNPLKKIAELLGATILGDGSVVPVLDLIYLLNSKIQNPKSKIQGHSDFDVSHSKARPDPARTQQIQSEQTTNSGTTAIPKQTKVMIVDDSPSVRHLTSNIIKKAGWEAIVAKDGLEALEILQEIPELPQVILTDVEMPRMDGYELLSTIKRQENLRNIPVVMITSRAGDKHRQKAYGLGVSEYLTKPFEDIKLVEIVKKLQSKNTVTTIPA